MLDIKNKGYISPFWCGSDRLETGFPTLGSKLLGNPCYPVVFTYPTVGVAIFHNFVLNPSETPVIPCFYVFRPL